MAVTIQGYKKGAVAEFLFCSGPFFYSLEQDAYFLSLGESNSTR